MDYMLSEQLRNKFTFDISFVTTGMMSSILMALALAAAMAAQQIVQAARVPTIRLQITKAPPDLPLAKGQTWHMFLSHIWGTGQDCCATIKRQLKLMVPGASVFLDVDDLKSIDALEQYISGSAVIMIFVSKGYFLSKSELPLAAQAPTIMTLADTLLHAPQIASEKCTPHWRSKSPCASSSTQCAAARRFTTLRPSVMRTCIPTSLGRCMRSAT